MLFSQVEERRGVKDISRVVQLLQAIVDLHIVVSKQSLVKEGANRCQCLPACFYCASNSDNLRCYLVKEQPVLLIALLKAKLNDNIFLEEMHLEGKDFHYLVVLIKKPNGTSGGKAEYNLRVNPSILI